MCLLLCLLYQCKQIIFACVCVLETAKHSSFPLPNPLSCSVMNKICLNQVKQKTHLREKNNILLVQNQFILFSFMHDEAELMQLECNNGTCT